MTHPPLRICFVCMGNICRSPTAEAIMRHQVTEAGMVDRVEIESAGTGDWHVGEAPDPRAAAEGRRRGLHVSGEGRQFRAHDFARFDLVVAMDRENEASLSGIAPDESARSRVHLLRAFHEESRLAGALDVPDPYFGGDNGFAMVFDIVENGCRGLLAHLTEGPLRG